MSLDYDLTATSLPTDDDGGRIWTLATEYLIFATISVGIGDLSAKNAPEFYARLQIIQDMDQVIPARRVNAADITQHIGLKTNVTGETRAHWLKRVVGSQMDREAANFTAAADREDPRPPLLRGTDRTPEGKY
jgi:hypothetical protein